MSQASQGMSIPIAGTLLPRARDAILTILTSNS